MHDGDRRGECRGHARVSFVSAVGFPPVCWLLATVTNESRSSRGCRCRHAKCHGQVGERTVPLGGRKLSGLLLLRGAQRSHGETEDSGHIHTCTAVNFP